MYYAITDMFTAYYAYYAYLNDNAAVYFKCWSVSPSANELKVTMNSVPCMEWIEYNCIYYKYRLQIFIVHSLQMQYCL